MECMLGVFFGGRVGDVVYFLSPRGGWSGVG